MPLHRKPNWLLSQLAFAVLLLASPVRGQELNAEWFKSNYLPAAERLEHFYGQCSADIQFTVKSERSALSIKSSFRFEFDDGRRKIDRTIEAVEADGSTTKTSRTIVASPDVSFHILTRGEKPVLDYLDRTPLGFQQATESIDVAASDSIYMPFMLLGQRVSSLVQDPAFRFMDAKRDADRVRLSFKYKKPTQEHDGWVEFLPERQWVIDSYDLNLVVNIGAADEYRYRVDGKLSYSDDNPVPMMKSLMAHSYHPGRTDLEETTVSDLRFGPQPEGDFKLSHYGYDDRMGTAATPTKSPWFWLAMVSLACLFAAFAIRRATFKRHVSSPGARFDRL